MSIRHLKATDRYYVVATGFTASDLIDSGEASDDGTYRSNTEWPESAVIAWFESRDQQSAHPALRAKLKESGLFASRTYIDAESGLSIPKMHASKAAEAREVKFNGQTDLAKLPFIAEELALQTGKTLTEMADEIWAEHILEAPAEAARTAAKRDLL